MPKSVSQASGMKVVNEDGIVIVPRLYIAQSHLQKLQGLMFDDSLKPDEALLIPNCQAIHCCFMKMQIDVLFLSDERRIVHAIDRMRPWTFSRFVKSAVQVLECYPGTIENHALREGQRLHFVSSRDEL